MSAIQKALDEIKFRVPSEVLKVAFRDDLQNWRQAPVSLDTLIMDKVIRPRVLVDANLVGGAMVVISLDGLVAKYSDAQMDRPVVRYMDSFTTVYEIPPDRVNHREIISVLSIGYMPLFSSFNGMNTLSGGNFNAQSMTDTMSAGQRLMDSHSNIPVVSAATCDLIGFNTVLIRDQLRVASAYQLRCMIANENNLNNINPRSYLAFSTLCEHAIKAYIYNKMIISMDQAYLSGGQELGMMKSYIETLADSESNYRTYLREVWQKVSMMNDSPSYTRFLKVQVSPGL